MRVQTFSNAASASINLHHLFESGSGCRGGPGSLRTPGQRRQQQRLVRGPAGRERDAAVFPATWRAVVQRTAGSGFSSCQVVKIVKDA
ncbi:Hypothetical predicted protein [Marmota monax]|uniref:Uncharacterized protein n=1 Tax=Marmota monax TaxID=9995 RepID=A0A5E4B8S7_MARMO|nr:hypothetical protein GHT09_009912 [Marmota monax]VTJ65271.1 Hypothetical predicted protein [Marmota monax]